MTYKMDERNRLAQIREANAASLDCPHNREYYCGADCALFSITTEADREVAGVLLRGKTFARLGCAGVVYELESK